jgi:hypothetical protein
MPGSHSAWWVLFCSQGSCLPSPRRFGGPGPATRGPSGDWWLSAKMMPRLCRPATRRGHFARGESAVGSAIPFRSTVRRIWRGQDLSAARRGSAGSQKSRLHPVYQRHRQSGGTCSAGWQPGKSLAAGTVRLKRSSQACCIDFSNLFWFLPDEIPKFF